MRLLATIAAAVLGWIFGAGFCGFVMVMALTEPIGIMFGLKPFQIFDEVVRFTVPFGGVMCSLIAAATVWVGCEP